MRNRHGSLPVLIKLCIKINIIYIVLIKHPLTALILTLNGNHGSAHLVAGQVGNLADQMRQPVKQVCHTAAFIVNDKKADIIRAEVQSQGQHIRLKCF